MVNFSKVFLQPLAVSSSSEAVAPQVQPEGASHYQVIVKARAGTETAPVVTVPRAKLLSITFSSIPLVTRGELRHDYVEIGNALAEMAAVSDDQEWGIDQPVYQVACYVAAELAAKEFPTPKLLTHGPKSVVFNWTNGGNNLYLTVSGDRMSALVSSPERIQRRVDFGTDITLQPLKLLGRLMALPPAQLASSSSTADFPTTALE